MKLICILMGLASLALLLGLVVSVLSDDSADGVDAGSPRPTEQ